MPFLIMGVIQLRTLVQKKREALPLLGVCGAFIFILSADRASGADGVGCGRAGQRFVRALYTDGAGRAGSVVGPFAGLGLVFILAADRAGGADGIR